MTTQKRRRIILIAGGVLVLALVVYGFLPDPVPVETTVVRRGSLEVIVEEEGETRLKNRYVVSSPVSAFARRIELEEGDPVRQGQPLVYLEPPRAQLLDVRSRAEAEARVDAARATVEQAEDNALAAEAAAQRATEEYERIQRLHESGSATDRTLEETRSEAAQADARLRAARAAVETARADLQSAVTTLRATDATTAHPVQEVLRAPAAGRVLQIHRKSAGLVSPGDPIIEIGDTGDLELHIDVLSQDAVRIVPGTRVLIDQWGGDRILDAVVDRIEPQGVTTVSSLGVEEKRVNVVARFASLENYPAGLGTGYRVLARFVIWEGDNVLIVPTSALFRTEGGWSVFVVEGGRAVRRDVDVGQQSGLAAQIRSGLTEEEVVIVNPPNEIEEGTRVEPIGN